MKLKDDNLLLSLGMWSLTLAILLGRFVTSVPFADFLEGVLYGVSMACNLAYLIRVRLKKSRRA